jgi:hypothetical protein
LSICCSWSRLSCSFWDYCRVGARSSDRVVSTGRTPVSASLTCLILPRAPNSHRALGFSYSKS